MLVILLNSNNVMANECIPCAPTHSTDFVCGVDEQGVSKKFQTECALRFENCDKKTSKWPKLFHL